VKRRIILVDDEMKVLDALRRSLRGMADQWDMDFVTKGQEALKMMENKAYDVIVSDMKMPEMSGDELLGKVRDLYPETARIVLSGHCSQSTAFRLVDSDHFYLSKPCARELFINTIEQAFYLNQPAEKPNQSLSNDELTVVVGELVKNLLIHGIIHISDVPEALRARFQDSFLEFFAPVLDETGHVKGSGDQYVSAFLDDADFETMSDEDSWFTDDNEKLTDDNRHDEEPTI